MNSLKIPECPPAEPLPPMSKRTLLQKYEIPVNHLDFDYVRECHDAKEIERMLLILRSGEEGYFPDLQRCTEQRLRVLNANSKLLREEEPVLRASALPKEEQDNVNEEMNGFFKDIQQYAEERKHFQDGLPDILPSIRKPVNTKETDKKCSSSSINRIRSCDYAQWDKYDADTELTKLDLSAERNRDAAEVTENKRAKFFRNLDETAAKVAEELNGTVSRMSEVEKRKNANNYRIQGNENFKAGEFEEAVLDYTRSLVMFKTSVAFSNRAMAYIKLKKNINAIRDCDECLQIDPRNVKAMLRKGQALINENRNTEAFRVYTDTLKVDPNNSMAAKAMSDLRTKIGDIPPKNAFRMKIHDDNEKSASTKPVAKPLVSDNEEVDFADLIIPKKIVTSRMSKMAETMKQMNLHNDSTGTSSKSPGQTHPLPSIKTRRSSMPAEDVPLRIPNNVNQSKKKQNTATE